ncbi:hypothetical protein C8R44DRAFT_755067 [Mycena epipterygia]|nr:hypothetical protein C8R44DRAFT_755067 [Mycena epipterygia]
MAQSRQNSDGSLRDASEIEFFNDVDDEHPISAPSSTKVSASRLLAPIFTQVDSGDTSSDESDAPSMDVNTEGEGEEKHDAMDVEQYEFIKPMADADHAHATVKIARADPMADINTIFKRVKGQKNPKTGVLEDGAICLVCT